MPDTLIDEVLMRFGPTGRALAELARRADVSASSALYALAERTVVPVLYAVCAVTRLDVESEGDEEEGRTSPVKALTVRASAAAPGVKYSLRSGTPIPEEHPVAVALGTQLPIAQESYVPFRSGRKMPAYVDAFPDRQRVLVSFALPMRPVKGEDEAAG